MDFSNSAYVTYIRLSPHMEKERDHKIDTITVHCMMAQWTAAECCDYFATTERRCSSNYAVGYDGSIGMSVEEKNRSYCSSSASNDHRAVTIEVASDTEPPYRVTNEAYAALIRLLADICSRNGIGRLLWCGDPELIGQTDKQNMTVHKWFSPKDCPGEYLYRRHGDIAQQVNKLLQSESR